MEFSLLSSLPRRSAAGAMMAVSGLFLLSSCGASEELLLGRLLGSAGDSGTGGSGANSGGGGLGGGSCTAPLSAPTRLYDFSGTGTEIVDRMGGLSGELRGGGALSDTGSILLDGVDDYVALPPEILGSGEELTVALWLTYGGVAAYQRLFDFGQGSAGTEPPLDVAAVGTTYLALTPTTGFVPSNLAVLFSKSGAAGETVAVTAEKLGKTREFLVVVVAQGSLSLYRNAELIAKIPTTLSLLDIEAKNNWLGRSQYAADPFAHVTYEAVSLYEEALPACAVTELFRAGPD